MVSISKLCNDCTLLGDLKCNLLEPDKGPKLERHLLNFSDMYKMKCLIDKPSRVTKESETLIDVILASKRNKFLCAVAYNPKISDHHLISVCSYESCMHEIDSQNNY